MKEIRPYSIIFEGMKIRIEAQGPLIKENFEKGVETITGGGAVFNIYSLKNFNVFDSQISDRNKLKESHEIYKVYELKIDGPLLSWVTETLHGTYPEISYAVQYIELFEKNEEVNSWMQDAKPYSGGGGSYEDRKIIAKNIDFEKYDFYWDEVKRILNVKVI